MAFGDWQAYPWKNELKTQSERVTLHYAEMVSDNFDSVHNPMDMLDRAIVLAAFAIRRLFEKRLVTDALRTETIIVRSFPAKGPQDFRPPYKSRSGGEVFRSYKFDRPGTTNFNIGDLANEIIHSSQFMFVCNEASVPNGLLVASDWHLKKRLLHLSIDEFNAIVQRVLDDRVQSMSDSWDPATGNTSATRD
jgi:hypothetical protein